MNAALESALPGTVQSAAGRAGAKHAARAGAGAGDFSKALADEAPPAADGTDPTDGADAKEDEAPFRPLAWVAPHAFAKTVPGRADRTLEAVADEAPADPAGDADAQSGAGGPTAADAGGIPNPAGGRLPATTQRTAAQAPAGRAAVSTAALPAIPRTAGGAPAGAREAAATAATPAADHLRAAAAGQSPAGRLDPDASADAPRRVEAKAVEASSGEAPRAAIRAEPRDPQAEIRVLSVQRTPAPAIIGEEIAGRSPAPAAAGAESTAPAAGRKVLHTLKIELHPAELGTVVARLRAVGEQLAVDLHVDSSEARHRLSSDSEAIVRALRALGYDIDRVNVVQPQPGSSGNSAGTGHARDGAFQPMSHDDGNGRSGGTGGGSRDDRPAPGQPALRDDADAPQNGLYI